MSRELVQIMPRLLTATQAAAYLGYEMTLLARIPVKPIRMVADGPGSQPKYDCVALDAWIDRLSGISVPPAAPVKGGAGDAQDDDPEVAYDAWNGLSLACLGAGLSVLLIGHQMGQILLQRDASVAGSLALATVPKHLSRPAADAS